MIALESLPRRLQPAFGALWAIDSALADVVSGTTETGIGLIRLAWWREALERLDTAEAPPEWRLKAVAEHLLPRGVSGTKISQLEGAWAAMLEPFPWSANVAVQIRRRGAVLFGIGARLLGWEESDGERAGELWSLVDVIKHCSDARSRIMLTAEARDAIGRLGPYRPPPALRPLTTLAALAGHDVIRGLHRPTDGVLTRGMIATSHMITGNFPRG